MTPDDGPTPPEQRSADEATSPDPAPGAGQTTPEHTPGAGRTTADRTPTDGQTTPDHAPGAGPTTPQPRTAAEPTTPGPSAADRGPRTGRVALLVVLVALVLGAAAVAVTAAGGDSDEPAAAPDEGTEGWHGALLGEPQPRPDFSLTDTGGRPYGFRAETQGRLTLLFFGYTSCPDICPIHMATLSSALEQPGMPDPEVVFVTTDPERDTPERLRSWLDNFGTDFVGLTGTPEQIAAAEDAAGVARSIVAADGAADDDYEVGHAAQIIAYTPDDQSHLQYPFGVRSQDWEADLPRMVETWSEPVVTVDGAWAAADDSITAVYLTIENTGPDDRLIGAETEVASEVTMMGPGVAMPAGGGSERASGTSDDTGDADTDDADADVSDTDDTDGPDTTDGTSSALDVEVPAGTTELAPGGTHMMLELTRALAPGEQISLRLTFDGAGVIDVPVDILDWDQVAERAADR